MAEPIEERIAEFEDLDRLRQRARKLRQDGIEALLGKRYHPQPRRRDRTAWRTDSARDGWSPPGDDVEKAMILQALGRPSDAAGIHGETRTAIHNDLLEIRLPDCALTKAEDERNSLDNVPIMRCAFVLQALVADHEALSHAALACFYSIVVELAEIVSPTWSGGAARANPNAQASAFITGECAWALLAFENAFLQTAELAELSEFERKRIADGRTKLAAWQAQEEAFRAAAFHAALSPLWPHLVIDIDRNIPPHDVPLIGSTAKVLVRSDLHPEIVPILLQAMVEAHGARAIFQHSGEFPNGTDTEYPVAPAATDFYKNGPSYMQRHVPLWLSVHVQRALAVLVTALAIGYPLFRLMPVAYTWINRRRLFYWYAQLKALEASFDTDPTDKHLTRKQAEIERIEDAVSHIQFPLTFSDQVYNLRSHIDIVRHKIVSHGKAPGADIG